jgi:DAACS family dicarboxylate/amino acid:cation (Na+ or H+) symporter
MALFEGVTVLFLAQFFQIEFSLTQQVAVMLTFCGIGDGWRLWVAAAVAMILVMVGRRPRGSA